MLRQVLSPGSHTIKSSGALQLLIASSPTLYFSRESYVLALSFLLSLTMMSSPWSVTSAALSCFSDGRQAPVLLEVQHLHCAGYSKGLKTLVSVVQIHIQTHIFLCVQAPLLQEQPAAEPSTLRAATAAPGPGQRGKKARHAKVSMQPACAALHLTCVAPTSCQVAAQVQQWPGYTVLFQPAAGCSTCNCCA